MLLYFVPTRVANEFRGIRKRYDNLTIPIIKRKLTAMIEATQWHRELIDEQNNIYKHEFNGIVIIVEKNNNCVKKVYTNPLGDKDDIVSASYYQKLCKRMGLNSDRKDFKMKSEEYINTTKGIKGE